jgi:CheY-like chemotaxis protein
LKTPRVLAVDDDPFNLDILQEFLRGAAYDVIAVSGGAAALECLEEHQDIDLVVLDRMMPAPNGMEVLERMKRHPKWSSIPVVMQTAAGHREQILEGMRAGAYYYLVKPYEEAMLLAMVKAALSDEQQRVIRDELRILRSGFRLATRVDFRFRTVAEARDVSDFIARCFPTISDLRLGLAELTTNAIEHGNLGITYAEKSDLLIRDAWEAEIERRQLLPENLHKYAELNLEISPHQLSIRLRDKGDGFDWSRYQEFSVERAADPHGRGIAMARALAFDSLEYIGSGNELRCSVSLSPVSDATIMTK